jgi:hypothetical protein
MELARIADQQVAILGRFSDTAQGGLSQMPEAVRSPSERRTMNLKQKTTGAGIAALLLAGGALGGSLLNAGAASNTTTATPGASGAPAGPNTNPAHEAAESPERAAAEASGKFPRHDGKFVPNTDPAHEKAESAAHAAQEAAGQFPTAP